MKRFIAPSICILSLVIPACAPEMFDDEPLEGSGLLEPDDEFELLEPNAEPLESACAVTLPWSASYCTVGCPCEALEGDCDSDLECAAGLECTDDIGGRFGVSSTIDGCQAPCMSEPSGIRAWWPGDSNAEDYVASNHGSLTSGASAGATGFSDRGFSFNGAGYMQAADNWALDFGVGDLTVAMWVKTTDTAGVKVLVDKRKEIANDVQGYVVYLASGELGFQLADGTGSSFCSTSISASCTNYGSGAIVADGKWHFLVVAVDRDNTSGLRFYVDGDLVKSTNPKYRPGSLSNDRPLRIGARSENGSGKIISSIDEVQLYARSLTAQEILGLYETGTNGLCRDNRCVPTSCSLGQCGWVSDGCGGTKYCGACGICGDGLCRSNENCANCPSDCSIKLQCELL